MLYHKRNTLKYMNDTFISSIYKYLDINDEKCSFCCSICEETAAHLLCENVDLSCYILNPTNVTHSFILDDIFLLRNRKIVIS